MDLWAKTFPPWVQQCQQSQGIAWQFIFLHFSSGAWFRPARFANLLLFLYFFIGFPKKRGGKKHNKCYWCVQPEGWDSVAGELFFLRVFLLIFLSQLAASSNKTFLTSLLSLKCEGEELTNINKNQGMFECWPFFLSACLHFHLAHQNSWQTKGHGHHFAADLLPIWAGETMQKTFFSLHF